MYLTRFHARSSVSTNTTFGRLAAAAPSARGAPPPELSTRAAKVPATKSASALPIFPRRVICLRRPVILHPQQRGGGRVAAANTDAAHGWAGWAGSRGVG